VDILRSWAEQTPQVQKANLFGSYAKGEAHGRSDVDVAVMASDGNWTALAGEWEMHLSEATGVKVNIRTLANDTVREYCADCSVPLKA
jgi:predicted nucleotidyltransferase